MTVIAAIAPRGDVYADLNGCIIDALADPATEDIIVDADGDVRVVASGSTRIAGRMEPAAIRRFCLRAAEHVGRYFSEESPRVSAILPGGERLEAVHPSVAPDGAAFVIRRPGPVLTLADLEAFGTITPGQRRVLSKAAGRRVVSIETDPEVQRPGNGIRLVAGGPASMRQLLWSALRLRPDLIVVGEVRDPEAAWCLVQRPGRDTSG